MGENGLGAACSYIMLNLTLSCAPKTLMNPWIYILQIFLAFALLIHTNKKKKHFKMRIVIDVASFQIAYKYWP